MTIIQPILVVLLGGGVLVYFMKFRSRLSDRAIVALLTVFAIVLVSYPELTSMLAHAVGVGRGVDLIIYLTLFGYGFILLTLVSKIRVLEGCVIELARAAALATAQIPRKNAQESAADPRSRVTGA